MAEITITIGGKTFDVACQDGEERYLKAAAALLDAEAETLRAQIGRLPENRMLLMAGLMLADKTAAIHDRIAQLENELALARQEVTALQNRPAPPPQKIEVPVIPPRVMETLAEIAARTEALATVVEERARSDA